MDSVGSADFWRHQIARRLDSLADSPLLDIGISIGVRPPGHVQFSAWPLFHWAFAEHLRYRVRSDGPAGNAPLRWVQAASDTICVAGEATWKHRHVRSPCRLCKVVLQPTRLVLMLTDGQGPRAFRSAPLADPGLPMRFQNAVCRSDHRREMRLRAVLAQALLEAEALAAQPADEDDRWRTRFETIIAHLDEHLADEHDRAAVAHRFDCHPSQLSRLFRRYAGTSFVAWLRERRLAEARRLLRDTSDPVHRIATSTGFGSATYLIRCFRAAFGITPERWRRRGIESAHPEGQESTTRSS